MEPGATPVLRLGPLFHNGAQRLVTSLRTNCFDLAGLGAYGEIGKTRYLVSYYVS
jgi:hypothetical protein